MKYVISQNCNGGKSVKEAPDDYANVLGKEIYDTREDCEAAIAFGLEPHDSKEKMIWTEHGFMVSFTKHREYCSEFISDAAASTPEEAASIVRDTFNVQHKAIKSVEPYSMPPFNYMEFFKKNHPPRPPL